VNNIKLAQELVRLAKELTGSKFKTLNSAIETAKANASRSGTTWYVNSTSDGIRVEKSPIKAGWAGNKTLAEVSPSGKVRKAGKKLWDDYTEKHFQRWLDHTIHDDEREEVESGIRELVESDPDLMSGSGHSWSELRDMARKNR
jgi:hypothetical protein